MTQNRVHVSAGVYTSEKDLSFVTKQIGVTTLGLVGETTKGPAFQPIFISDYDEFRKFFGGLNPKKINNGYGGFYPQYELPYIAKPYLTKSNQLFVTRVLGLSGYDAGLSWSLSLDANVDESTIVALPPTSGLTMTYKISISGNTISNITNTDVDEFYQEDALEINLLGITSSGATFNQNDIAFYKNGTNTFKGISFTGNVTGHAVAGDVRTVTVSNLAVTKYTATSFADVEGMVIATLRSRGKYTSGGLDFDIDNSGDVVLDAMDAEFDPYGDFTLSGVTQTSGVTFSHLVSFDPRKKNYISKVLGVNEKDAKTNIFVEEIYNNTLKNLITSGKVKGVKTALNYHGTNFSNYKQEYSPAQTPFVVSELIDNKVLKLFKLITISDGNSANTEIKFSIANINLESKTFDVQIRAFSDSDANPVILERFSRCSMNPSSSDFIGRKIGTIDGDYESRSKYVLLELDSTDNTSEAIPAGVLGVPTRMTSVGIQAPNMAYKTKYSVLENKRKVYLGLSSVTGIDNSFLQFKGIDNVTGINKGFHMDKNATTAVIYNGTDSTQFKFEVGSTDFKTEESLLNTEMEQLFARKFTFVAYGGFDGWDVYRDYRTNDNNFSVNKFLTEDGYNVTKLNINNLVARTQEDGTQGTNSDYYAYLEGINTFSNPEAVNINVFATPGIDLQRNSNLITETIEMIEIQRADSLYITTTPNVKTPQEAVDALEDSGIDSNYTATFWPWVQVNDTENNVLIELPVTRDLIKNIAITDNISFPWYSVAGIQRGDVDANRAVKKLTLSDRDILLGGRINPVATFASEGVKIWGNNTLQVKETALNKINVRRLLLQTRKLISAVSLKLLFDQNDDIVRNKFLSLVNPILENIRSERGLTAFKVEVDRSPESMDRNELVGRILIKPTKSLEFITLEFGITNTGANFDNI